MSNEALAGAARVIAQNVTSDMLATCHKSGAKVSVAAADGILDAVEIFLRVTYGPRVAAERLYRLADAAAVRCSETDMKLTSKRK